MTPSEDGEGEKKEIDIKIEETGNDYEPPSKLIAGVKSEEKPVVDAVDDQ